MLDWSLESFETFWKECFADKFKNALSEHAGQEGPLAEAVTAVFDELESLGAGAVIAAEIQKVIDELEFPLFGQILLAELQVLCHAADGSGGGSPTGASNPLGKAWVFIKSLLDLLPLDQDPKAKKIRMLLHLLLELVSLAQ